MGASDVGLSPGDATAVWAIAVMTCRSDLAKASGQEVEAPVPASAKSEELACPRGSGLEAMTRCPATPKHHRCGPPARDLATHSGRDVLEEAIQGDLTIPVDIHVARAQTVDRVSGEQRGLCDPAASRLPMHTGSRSRWC
jgi:hypothetical protein